jgi:hypothetical protein
MDFLINLSTTVTDGIHSPLKLRHSPSSAPKHCTRGVRLEICFSSQFTYDGEGFEALSRRRPYGHTTPMAFWPSICFHGTASLWSLCHPNPSLGILTCTVSCDTNPQVTAIYCITSLIYSSFLQGKLCRLRLHVVTIYANVRLIFMTDNEQ